MTARLHFLPVPSESDPLLLRWFDQVLGLDWTWDRFGVGVSAGMWWWWGVVGVGVGVSMGVGMRGGHSGFGLGSSGG